MKQHRARTEESGRVGDDASAMCRVSPHCSSQ